MLTDNVLANIPLHRAECCWQLTFLIDMWRLKYKQEISILGLCPPNGSLAYYLKAWFEDLRSEIYTF